MRPRQIVHHPSCGGVEHVANERLAPFFREFSATRDTYVMQFPFGPAAAMDFFLRNMGPVNRAYAMLHGAGQEQALHADLERFFQESNEGRPEAWQVDSEYLKVEARKR